MGFRVSGEVVRRHVVTSPCIRTSKRQWLSVVHAINPDTSEAGKSYLLMVRR
jgi:hypothetical protein